jgi:hypothetical protein
MLRAAGRKGQKVENIAFYYSFRYTVGTMEKAEIKRIGDY